MGLPAPLRITILVPFLRLTGGSKILVDLANGLADRGHRVTAVVPVRLKPLPAGLSRVEALWRRPSMLRKYRWFTPRFSLQIVATLDERWVPDGDVVVASSFHTAEIAASYPERCGRKVYFIQDVETHQHPRRAEATYRLPMLRIVTSGWIESELRSRFGVAVDGVVPLGIDPAVFSGKPREALPARQFGLLYSTDPRKGMEDAMRAFGAVRERVPGLIMAVMGAIRKPPALPEFARGSWNVPPAETPPIYAAADAWICSSRSEGWGLPPQEAMAMGCAVVTTRVGGTPYFAHHERTALVCDPGDVAGLERAIERLATDGALVRRLSEAGIAESRSLTWADTVRQFDVCLG